MFTMFSYKISEKQILLAIILFGALLRFWGLGSAEFFHDEGLFAFRSIGYLDYIQNDNQTTPVQWFTNQSQLPWWTSLSFHDHPPLFFIIQQISFNLFGDSFFAARLPSAVSGILAIYLVYLILKRFFVNPAAPLFAAFLLSISSIHIWISRSSLLEAFQLFLILLNIYYFFRFLDDQRQWRLFGLTLGLAFLTKYTSIFLVPAYGFYLLIFQRDIYKKQNFYLALGLAAILFSPVLIYNFYLWETIGHFDLQFSYLFSQATPEWQALLGKTQDPFSNILKNLIFMYSLPFLLLAMAGIGYATYKNFNSRTSFYIFWLLNFIFITLMLVKVGSAFRFIVLYAVPAIMLIAALFDYLFSKFHKEVLFRILLAVFLAYELFFALSIFSTFPNFGIVQLDKYLNSEFRNARSLAIPVSPNPHLNDIIQDYALKIPAADNPIMIIYDENISLSPRLWLFTRRNYYHGIPAVTVDQFKKFSREQGIAGFQGYDFYFIKASDKTYLNPLYFNPAGQELEVFLQQELNLSANKMIYGYNNFLMFTIYKFSL
ncbi:MAG: glycosyltransferase family 39 protein [bacterium]|nr:glycosyltransferase family 39 protein [bacterium]